MKIGFIGQGWIGKNYADHFEDAGFDVIRYSLEEPYIRNKDRIAEVDVVFIAVPTPTTPSGFDDRHVRTAVALSPKGSTVVIKSTIPMGLTKKLDDEHADLFIFHVPEFLREAHARYDVDNPERLIIGMPKDTDEYKKRAEAIRSIHPKANYTKITNSHEAEMIKYAHNSMGYATVVFANLLYDLAESHGIEWGSIKEAILSNPWYPSKYLDPVHKSGRGAGGNCFIKDFATLANMYEEHHPNDVEGNALLRAMIKKNNQLLRSSGKDLGLLKGVHGEE
jgi:UDPglucose 6-dehydrogenase